MARSNPRRLESQCSIPRRLSKPFGDFILSEESFDRNYENLRGSFPRSRELVSTAAACLLLALPLVAIQLAVARNREFSNKMKCSNNLRSIYAAMQLYANDYRFFPHMSAAHKDDSAEDVSTAFRTLIYLKYLDEPDALWCPSAEEYPAQSAGVVAKDPRKFTWELSSGAMPQRYPIFNKAADPSIDLNENLSYSNRRKQLALCDANRDELLCSDKSIRYPDISSGPYCPEGFWPPGSHDDGTMLLHGDGYVRFIPLNEAGTIARTLFELQLGTSDEQIRKVMGW